MLPLLKDGMKSSRPAENILSLLSSYRVTVMNETGDGCFKEMWGW